MKRRWRYLFGAFLLAAGLLAGCADGVVPTQQPAQETERGAAGQQEQETAQEPGSRQESETRILEEGTYTSKEEVAEYIALYGHLPDNFITKKEAKALGWVSSEGNLAQAAPGRVSAETILGILKASCRKKKAGNTMNAISTVTEDTGGLSVSCILMTGWSIIRRTTMRLLSFCMGRNRL